ncbi:MAG: GGDEF domain-containing protein [Oscillospiraceae bacterium]
MKKAFLFIKDKYVNPNYPFQDRLFFLFGTAGIVSAAAAIVATLMSELPLGAMLATLFSFVFMVGLMIVSLFLRDITIARLFCSVFLNFIMFPMLFWITGGADCGMAFYFILALCVSTLILDGKVRVIVLTLALIVDTVILYLGFLHPEWGYQLSYNQRKLDNVSSFVIVSLFVISVILIMSMEYIKQHKLVMENNKDLEFQANTDNMTTLYNHSYLLSTLQEQIKIRSKSREPLSIAMFDIDNFKQVNDICGHLTGNQVLCQFAAILKEASGGRYIATRYGGDEFVVVLPENNEVHALEFAEKVRLAAQYDPALQGLTQSGITVSGGVAQWEKSMTVDGFIHRADIRLYEAKRGGKNKVAGIKPGAV